jgi:hypothetical protein
MEEKILNILTDNGTNLLDNGSVELWREDQKLQKRIAKLEQKIIDEETIKNHRFDFDER